MEIKTLIDDKMRTFLKDENGFTLVEMIIVAAIFVVVIIITGQSLDVIMKKSGSLQSREESNIEGVVGLELMRHDMQQAGLGLFTSDNGIPSYSEAAGLPYLTYNDSNAVPRPVVAGNNLISVAGVKDNTDYLVIKATTVGRNSTSQKWTYVDSTGVPKIWGRDDFTDSHDKIIFLKQKYDSSKNTFIRELIKVSDSNYGVAYSPAGAFTDQDNNSVTNYTPGTNQIYYLYGIDNMGAAFTFRAPFNRADFFVFRDAGTPSSCAPNSGVLYKSVMNHVDGSFTKIPILDCVADMQVVLGWNTSGTPENSSEVQAWSNADGTTSSGNTNGLNMINLVASPEEIRNRLRLIMVYLLVQEGKKDSNFTNTNTAMLLGDRTIDPSGTLSKMVDLTQSGFQNYRWKLFRIVVRPKNIN